MHYGIGPEVFANYRRHELYKAAKLEEPSGERPGWDDWRENDGGRGALEWLGRLLIAAGERLSGSLGATRTTRRTA